MKKMFLMVALVLFAIPAFAVENFTTASPPTVPAGQADAGKVLSSLSNKVIMTVVSDTTSFSAVTAHTSGSKQFATGSDSTKIYSSAYGDGVDLLGLTASDTSQYATWSAL